MFLLHYSCLSTVFSLFILHSSHTLSILTQPDHKLETEIRLILDRHNQYRTCHHVPPLIIDPQLTKEAQSLAITLASEQINLDQARRWRHGNLFITQWNLQLDDLFAMNENSKFSFNPVDKWYNEVKFYYDDRSRTDHFTRIVWKDSKKLGVGIAQNDKGFVYIVCKYDPEGNIPGQYDNNVIIPDKKMIHATDICIFPPLTSPSKKKDTTLAGPRKTAGTGSKVEPVSAASTDFKVSTSYSQPPSSTGTYDQPMGGSTTIFTSTATQVDVLGSLHAGSMTSTYAPSMASSQTDLSGSSDASLFPSAQATSTVEPGYSSTASDKSTHLGSMIWSRITSTTLKPDVFTIGSSFPMSTAAPVSLQDLLITTPGSAPPSASDGTPSFGIYESTSSPSSIDGFSTGYSTSSSFPESRPDEFVSTSTMAPHLSTGSTLAPHLSTGSTLAPHLSTGSTLAPHLSTGSTLAPHISTYAKPESSSSISSIPPEYKERLCNMSDPAANVSCVLPTDQPQGVDQESQTPSSNRTTGWLDFPEHEYGNQTGDAFSPFGKPEHKAEYLKFTLLFMGLLVASMSAAVSLLAVFALFKLFVCCRRARSTSRDAPSSPAAQTPSHMVSVIPTTNPRPISPTLSRPGSPAFQKTILSAKVY